MASQEAATLSSSAPPCLSPQTDGAPALTVLWHPDLSRIGAMFSFADLAEGQCASGIRIAAVVTPLLRLMLRGICARLVRGVQRRVLGARSVALPDLPLP